ARPENANDRWIPDAATAAAARHDVGFLTAVAASKQAPGARAQEVVGRVAEHFARGGQAEHLDALLAAFAGAGPRAAEAFIASLAKGWPRDKAVSLKGETTKALQRLLTVLPPAGRGQLLRVAAAWGVKDFEQHAAEIVASLLAAVGNEKESDDA